MGTKSKKAIFQGFKKISIFPESSESQEFTRSDSEQNLLDYTSAINGFFLKAIMKFEGKKNGS